MSDTDTEGCGQWLTAKDKRTLKKTASQKRNRKSKAAEKVLSRAANGIISRNSFGLDAKWSWFPHSPQTKELIRRTKQTKMERFMKPSRTEQHVTRTIENPTKSVPLKRHRQPDASLGEHDGDEMCGFAQYTENSKEGSCESKENILHNSRKYTDKYSLGFLSGPASKRLKSNSGKTDENKVENRNEVDGRTVLVQDDSPVFQYTQWVKEQVQECQQLQEVYTTDSLPSLQQTVSERVTVKEKGTPRGHLCETNTAEKFSSEGKDALPQQVEQRCELQSACDTSGNVAAKQHSHKDSTANECIPKRIGAEKSTQDLETQPNFSERWRVSSSSPVQVMQCHSHEESQFHFSQWVRNQISDCERLQWDCNSPGSHGMIAGE